MSGMRSNDGGSNNNQARVRRAHAQIVPRETKEPNVATELRLQIMHCCCVNENVQAARVLCIDEMERERPTLGLLIHCNFICYVCLLLARRSRRARANLLLCLFKWLNDKVLVVVEFQSN